MGRTTHLLPELCHRVGRSIAGPIELRCETRRVPSSSALQVRHLMALLLLLLLASLSPHNHGDPSQPS